MGVFIDKSLSWKKHITETSKKIASAIGGLKRIRQFIFQKSAETISVALVEPQFDYCSIVWDGISKQLSDKLQKLQKLQNRAARVTTISYYDTSSSVLLDKLGWEQIQIRRKRQKAVTVNKAIHELTLFRLGGGGLLMPAPTLISSQFLTIKNNPSISQDFSSNLSGNLVMW